MSRARALFVCLAVSCAALTACPETKEDLVTQGNLALWRKDADGAIAQFDKVLKMDAADVDAHRGMANAYDEKGDDGKVEEWLRKGHTLPKLVDQDRRFFQQRLVKLFIGQAEKTEAPAAKEKALKSALEVDDAGKANGLLAQHWREQGAALAKEGKLAEAADMLAGVLDLKVSRKTKEAAMTSEIGHRLTLFRKTFDAEFEARHQPGLVAAGIYDVATKRFKVAAQGDLPPNIPANDPDLVRRAADIAGGIAYKNLLTSLAKLSGKALPDPPPNLSFRSWQADSEGWVRKPSTYRYAASIQYDEAAQAVFMIAENDRIEAARKKIAPPAPRADEPAAAAAAPAPTAAPAAPGSAGDAAAAPAAPPAAPAAPVAPVAPPATP